MNKQRRTELKTVYAKIRYLRDELVSLMDEEVAAYNNLPENLQYSERAEQMSEAIDNMVDAQDSLEEAMESLKSAF